MGQKCICTSERKFYSLRLSRWSNFTLKLIKMQNKNNNKNNNFKWILAFSFWFFITTRTGTRMFFIRFVVTWTAVRSFRWTKIPTHILLTKRFLFFFFFLVVRQQQQLNRCRRTATTRECIEGEEKKRRKIIKQTYSGFGEGNVSRLIWRERMKVQCSFHTKVVKLKIRINQSKVVWCDRKGRWRTRNSVESIFFSLR